MKRAWLLLALAGCTEAGRASRVSEPEYVPAPASAGRLRAGEVNDNDRFDEYLRYFKAYPERNVRKIDVTDRMVLTLVDADGRPLAGVPVRILAEGEEVHKALTTAGGQLMFPPRAVGVDPRVRSFTAVVEGRRIPFERGDDLRLDVDVAQAGREEADIDVAFCLDTTGSMADEIDRIRRTLRDVVRRVEVLEPRPRLRFGMVVYRDRGDEYVTRTTPFTGDLERFMAALERVRAAGGGDYEEAVSEALSCAVDDLGWSPGSTARLLFLIGDAPPHPGDAEYVRPMRRALEKGVKIHTLAASGLDDRGEFIWRQLAQFTMGRFMFISYGGTSPHHVGGYVENNLDDIMVRAIRAELESLRSRPSTPRGPSRGRGRAADDFRDYQGHSW